MIVKVMAVVSAGRYSWEGNSIEKEVEIRGSDLVSTTSLPWAAICAGLVEAAIFEFERTQWQQTEEEQNE